MIYLLLFQYLKSLEAMGPKKLGRGQAGGGHSIKNKKMVLMDLNGDSDDDNHDDGTMEREKQVLEQLEWVLTKCQLCQWEVLQNLKGWWSYKPHMESASHMVHCTGSESIFYFWNSLTIF